MLLKKKKTNKMKNKLVSGFIIGTFVMLYVLVSLISTIHVIDFFELSNPRGMAIALAVAFEIGAAASLASLITLDKMNKTLVWALFIAITAMQMQGNMYYAFMNLEDFHADSTTTLKVTKDGFDSKSWIKELNEVTMEITLLEQEIKIAKSIHDTYFK